MAIPFERDIPRFPGEDKHASMPTAETSIFSDRFNLMAADIVAEYMSPRSNAKTREDALQDVFFLAEDPYNRVRITTYIQSLRESILSKPDEEQNHLRRERYGTMLGKIEKRFGNAAPTLENRTHKEQEKLHSGEVLLMPKPGFLVTSAGYGALVELIRTYINPNKKNITEEDITQNADVLDPLVREHGFRTYRTLAGELVDEYIAVFNRILSELGSDKVQVVDHTVMKTDEHDRFGLASDSAHFDNQVEAMYPSIHLGEAANPSSIYPRDLFTAIGDFVFVNPEMFPNLQETEQYRTSLLGIGGMVLHAGNVILMSESFRDLPELKNDVRLLKENGFHIGYLPDVDEYKQPEEKREFVEGHIDGHASLLTDKDGQLNLVVAKSYVNQDSRTYTSIVSEAIRLGLTIAQVDDSNQNHLALNIVQLRDGSVIYPYAGRYVNGTYQKAQLDDALADIVGVKKLIITKPFIKASPIVRAGVRCMTNIVPRKFLDHITKG